jgi:SAM-dependent methyltransferase
LWLNSVGAAELGDRVLHFAAEPALKRLFRDLFPTYLTVDIKGPADLLANIECLGIRGDALTSVVCNHVLEHVDDRRALTEICRALLPDGLLICSVPLVESWDRTYEPGGYDLAAERELHFGQGDHVRYFGSDFVHRVAAAGFELVCEYQGSPEQCVRYSLIRGEKLFVFRKIRTPE